MILTMEAPVISDRTLIRDLGEMVLAEAYFAKSRSGELFHYRDGVYAPGGEEFVKQRVKKLALRLGQAARWCRSLALEVVEFIAIDSPELDAEPPCDRINLLNGILNIWTGELEEHSPRLLSPIRIPIEYDPEATCPAIERFVADVFPADATELAWEILGDLLTPDRSIQKAICFVGEGGNGKGVFCELCARFVGPENVSHLSLQKLERDRFAPARLYGKLANICPDLPGLRLEDSAMFKALTGCDRITGEMKYRNMFEFRPYARLLFSANHLPASRDSSRAYFDRWIIVPFETRFRDAAGATPRGVLDARLSTGRELSGALNRALPALHSVRRSGYFTESPTLREASREFVNACDFFENWLNAETVAEVNACVVQAELYAAFSLACAAANRSPVTKQMFGRFIKRRRPEIQEVQRTIGGTRQWAYRGLALRNANGTHSHAV